MRDINRKTSTLRTASATAVVRTSPATIQLIRRHKIPKGDPISVARVAGIMAAKNTPSIIPFCHPIPIDHADCTFTLERDRILVATSVTAIHKTGVEMEALAAASVAALTLYDMLKPVDDALLIEEVRLTGKRGGKSDWRQIPPGVKGAVLVFSDSTAARKRKDVSGKRIVERLKKAGIRSVSYKVLPDDYEKMVEEMTRLADKRKVDLIITTGSTGLGPRDFAPEATRTIIDREVPGIAETIRKHGQDRLPMSMLSRSVSGLRGTTLIVNLPGSVKGVEEGMDAILTGVFHWYGMVRGKGH